MTIDAIIQQNDDSLINSGFVRGPFYYYRKKGNSFQCITVGRGKSYNSNGLFLVIFPFWTACLRRISPWPSFIEAFINPEIFANSQINWPSYYIEITKSFWDYCDIIKDNSSFKYGANNFINFVESKMLPFMDGIHDDISYKNAMISINRHCRVFEEIILLECVKLNNIAPAKHWLALMDQIDSKSTKKIAELVYSPRDKRDFEYYKAWGWNSFNDAYKDAEAVIKITRKLFYGKLINSIDSNDYNWIKHVFAEAQNKSRDFFYNYFNLEFEQEVSM